MTISLHSLIKNQNNNEDVDDDDDEDVENGKKDMFMIGRTLDVSSVNVKMKQEKNDFELNGMGIKSRHCCFKNQSDTSDTSLVVQPLSIGATVYVNGNTLEEVDDDGSSSLLLSDNS
eukprot:CAMPEP_0114347136 /NCGR_PEP_ID=MMETSP0101-20121206/13655_1 /TAXON_ID=38822 ORGANISM="Pteridomonas danica, Strain PT" /NCGR_SAMPLE_ID=MMETSP0101 /ASSEMBLY_ACC=CAM_ASM_000211 /LENGTH=116 /DNA_ID=CAMNT_0001484257 /DNA_START=385 /DNA_END=731 /DNA_ORIENTATION=-